jgi:hypothetical protein
MGVLYGHMGTIQPHTANCHYGHLLACLISRVIVFVCSFWVARFAFCVLRFVFCVLRFVFCVLCFVFCVLCFGVGFLCLQCFVFCVLCFGFGEVLVLKKKKQNPKQHGAMVRAGYAMQRWLK